MEARLRQWTLEDKLAIFKEWEAKTSFIDIAAKWNCTPNTIAGMVFRMRKRMGVVPHRQGSNTKRPKRPKPQGLDPATVSLLNRIQEAKTAPRIRLKLLEPIEEVDTAVTLAQLESYHCRWPVSSPNEEFKYCGKPRVGELSYCAAHCAMAYVPPKERRH